MQQDNYHEKMRRSTKYQIEDGIEAVFYRVSSAINERISAYRNGQPEQMYLLNIYQNSLSGTGNALPFDEAGFRFFSQFDEDGLLLYILAAIGFGRRTCLDIGCGRPMGSNSANLFANWSFSGLGVDGSKADIDAARRWYQRCRSTMFSPPDIINRIINVENVNELIEEATEPDSQLDVLSLDIDGIDFWILKAIRSSPRIIIAEFNPFIPRDRSVTVPHRDPITSPEHLTSGYYGCSLRALVELANFRGYRLVGVSAGVNAFFVLESEIPEGLLPPVTVSTALDTPRRSSHFRNCEDHTLLSREWVEV